MALLGPLVGPPGAAAPLPPVGTVAPAREGLLPAVVREYAALRDERLGVVEALVRTAMPLEFDETEGLRKALEAKTGKKVRMRIEVDPALIGGVVVRLKGVTG